MIGDQNIFGEEVHVMKTRGGALAQSFLIPPFSVLNAREGAWQERKRQWIAKGIKSELGRGEVMGSLASARRAQLAAPGGAAMPAADYSKSKARGDGTGKPHGKAAAIHAHPRAGKDTEEVKEAYGDEPVESWVTSSIFDPVLCEAAYEWFSAPGWTILDPFAGGSVRGLVAGCLGRKYHGVDLRAEQIAANEVQANEIETKERPHWYVGDSRDLKKIVPAALKWEVDFIFTCPPYGNLEVYSEDPRDISTMDYAPFMDAMDTIIGQCCDYLKRDRFACMVVGDFRDEDGFYRQFPWDVARAFRKHGAGLVNEAVLTTAVGSLSVRAKKQFEASRKLGKTHQNILVFCKGDPGKAAEAILQAQAKA